jgi:hypothetical protein
LLRAPILEDALLKLAAMDVVAFPAGGHRELAVGDRRSVQKRELFVGDLVFALEPFRKHIFHRLIRLDEVPPAEKAGLQFGYGVFGRHVVGGSVRRTLRSRRRAQPPVPVHSHA